MITTRLWAVQQPKGDGEKNTVSSISLGPDGTRIVVSKGRRILMYDATDGSLLKSLRGHKGDVYSVSYSADGSRFASGGADGCAIIWDGIDGKGVVRYSHAESVQVVAFNPVRDVLVSCSNVDFGFWTPGGKAVAKHKLRSKALSASWTRDGQVVAIGLLSGVVTVRDLLGKERLSIERSAPIWCLDWRPRRHDDDGGAYDSAAADDDDRDVSDVLAVGCWDGTLSFYYGSGLTVCDDTKLDFYPCCMHFFNRKSLVVGGSNKDLSLFRSGGGGSSGNGYFLCKVASLDGWVWAATGNGKKNTIIASDHSGGLSSYSFRLTPVYSVDGDYSAWCAIDNTELRVQHMSRRQVDRIDCDSMIESVCIHGRHLAIKLKGKIVLCELSDQSNTLGKLYDRLVVLSVEQHDILALTSREVVVCRRKNIDLLDFSGNHLQEWEFESIVRSIEVGGGPDGGEIVLVGLEDGNLSMIYIGNPFPVFLLCHSDAVSKVTINRRRTHVAIVDDEECLYVYNLASKEILFREDGVQSVAFNEEECDLLCYSGCGAISIRSLQESDGVYVRTTEGSVVKFRGSRVFLFREHVIEPFDVDLSSIVLHLMAERRFDAAFRVACSGVSESAWARLADGALDALELSISKDAFLRFNDYTFLEVIDRAECELTRLSGNETSLTMAKHRFRANVALIRRKYHEAAEHFLKAEDPSKAIGVFVDLRLWEDAKSVASAAGFESSYVILKQAEWAERQGDKRLAIELYQSGEGYLKAIRLIGETKEKGWGKSIINIARKLSSTDIAALESCVKYLIRSVDEHASEILEINKKLKNFKGCMEVCVKTRNWKEAAATYREHEGTFHRCASALPYADWLIAQNEFHNAFCVYRNSGNVARGWRLISELSKNAIVEGRLKDVSYYYWVLASEATRGAESCDDPSLDIHYTAESYRRNRFMAQLYHAYDSVQEFCDDSFSRLHPEALFHLSAYLMNSISVTATSALPMGISLARICYTFSKQARRLGAYHSARIAYRKMQDLIVPVELASGVNLDTMTIQAMPTEDNSELMPVCYRCGVTNSILKQSPGSSGAGSDDFVIGVDDGDNLRFGRDYADDSCSNCGHPFLRCGMNYDVLPLVEFIPDKSIASDQDVMSLIEVARSEDDDDEEEEETTDGRDDDPFTESINYSLVRQKSSLEYVPTTVDEATLRALDREEVFVLTRTVASKGDNGYGKRFYKNVIPEIGISACPNCNSFFHEEDFELAVLENGGACILCRKRIENYGHL